MGFNQVREDVPPHYRVIIQERAGRDLAEAFGYIDEQAPDAAKYWYRRLKDGVDSLCEMPARCGLAPEAERLGFELRQLIVGKKSAKYRIVFRILEDKYEVHILAVRHGARRPIDLKDIE